MRIVWTGLLLGLMVAMLRYPRVLVATKYVLDPFANGESAVKVLLLLLFLAVLSALGPFRSLWNEAWNRWLLGGLVVLYGIVVAEYVSYCRHFGLPPAGRSVLVYDGLQSSTRLEHMHNCKAALSVLLPYQGQSFDAGGPFVSVYPTWILLVHGFLFALLSVACVLFVHHYGKELTPERMLFLALGIYPLVKGGVDGGPFDYVNAAKLGFLALVLLKGRARRAVLVVALCLFVFGFGLETHKGIGHNILKLSIALVGLALPLFFEQARLRRSPGAAVALVSALVFFLGSPFVNYELYGYYRSPPSGLATWRYGDSLLKEGWTVHVVSPGELPDSEVGQVLSTSRVRRLRVSRVKLKRNTSPFELCRLYGLNVVRTPVIWYQEPGYVVIEGPFKMEDPAGWLHNEVVLRYAYQVDGGETRLVLEMIPGAQTNVACDVLPPGPFATYRVDMVYQMPKVPEWKAVRR